VEDLVEGELMASIENTKSLIHGASGAGAVVHKLPQSPTEVKDDGRFHYAVLGPEAASRPGHPSEHAVRFISETTGPDRPRVNKNAIILAVPSADLLDTARNRIRDHLAWKEVRDNMLKKEEIDELRRQRLRQNIKASKDKIQEAIEQAYSVAVTADRDGDAVAFKVPTGESSLFQQIKNHDKARIRDAAITPETILPGGPYDLWREGEDKRRVAHVTQAFSEQTRLPKMLNPEGIYDTIALGCEEGIFVLELDRPDGSVRTAWRTEPERSLLEDDGLWAVLPQHAELADLDPSLLTPGGLPGLWEEETQLEEETSLKVDTIYNYFSGDHAVEIPKDGYSEYESIPKASPEVLHEAIGEAVSRSLLWLQHGKTSLFGEDIPDEGLIGPETTLQPPPEPISATELLPANLPDAWGNGSTTAARLASALSEQKGEPLPWPLVKQAIDGAFQASYLTRSVKSGPWPTDRAGAEQVVIEVPKEDQTTKNDPSTGQPGIGETNERQPRPGDYGSSVRRAESDVEVHELQDLADEVAEIANIAAPYGIRFHIQIDAGTEEEVPDDVVARINEALRRVSGNLEL
jgi:hypothetical protein